MSETKLLLNKSGTGILATSDSKISQVSGIVPQGTYNILAPGSYDVTNYKYAQVVDANLTPSNIRETKSILGITGTLHEGIEPSGNINLTTINKTDVRTYNTTQIVDANLLASNIKNGVSILGIIGTFISSTLVPQSKTTTPTAVAQSVAPDTGYTVLSSVTVNPVPYTDVLDSHGGHIITIL